MLIVYIVCISFLAQLITAVLSFRLVKYTGKNISWALIATAMLLQAVRRLLTLESLMEGKTKAAQAAFSEWTGLVLSLLMLFGIIGITAFFRMRDEDITDRERMASINSSRLNLIRFSYSHTLDELLEETLNQAESLTGSLIGFIHFVDDDQKSLTLQNWSARTKKEFCKAEGKGSHYDIASAGVWVECVYQKKPVIHNDYRSLPNKKGMPAGHAEVIRELVVPVIRKDKITAILGVGNKSAEYNQKDSETVSLLADLAWEIAERKRMEEFLKKSEEKYRLVAENSNDWIYLLGRDGDILFISPSCERITGYTPKEFRKSKKFISDIFHPDDREKFLLHQKSAEEDNAYHNLEFRIVSKFGDTRWISHSCGPVYNDHGNFQGRAVTNRDITERKIAEEEVRNLNRELEKRIAERTLNLEEANKELESFSYSVSHDLRSPLRAIDGFSKVLQEKYSEKMDSEGIRFLRIIRDNTGNMSRLIDDLLSFSRIGKQEIHLSCVDLKNLIQSIFMNFQSEYPERKMSLNILNVPECNADPALIKIVLTNLISNAVKFTSKKPEALIEFGCNNSNGDCEYYIRDNGVGFNMNYVDKIFGVFQRLHSQNEFEGTGVGLALVQRIIHRHGGQIRAEGRADEGAVFYFSLPVKKEDNHEGRSRD